MTYEAAANSRWAGWRTTTSIGSICHACRASGLRVSRLLAASAAVRLTITSPAAGRGRETSGGVDGVPERREVIDRTLWPGRTDIRDHRCGSRARSGIDPIGVASARPARSTSSVAAVDPLRPHGAAR